MGTNVAPIYTNIYMAMLENELQVKCKTDPKLIWPILFKRFIDDGYEIEKKCFTGFKNSMNYEKMFKLTNIIGEIHSIIWIFLFTKVMLFTRMGNSQSLFIKKRQINSCISHTDPSIKDTLSRIMSGANLNVMCVTTRRKKTLKNSEHVFIFDSVTADSRNMF